MSFGGASPRSLVTSVCGWGTAGGGEAGPAVSRIPQAAELKGIARATKHKKRAIIPHFSNAIGAGNAAQRRRGASGERTESFGQPPRSLHTTH